jgi:hypothetical protein
MAGLVFAAQPASAALAYFHNFESGHVRPLAVADELLFAVNTPDNRLEIFDLKPRVAPPPPAPDGRPTLVIGTPFPKHLASVAVGLEPVAVIASRDSFCFANGMCPYRAWVVNHLSDSITAIDLQIHTVTRELAIAGVRSVPTCDEPRDIVLAGATLSGHGWPRRAFVTTARRGQSCPVPAELQSEGQPRALVQVFDSQTLAAVSAVSLFTDTPRALAVSADKRRVYAAGFLSGNQTSVLVEPVVSERSDVVNDLFVPLGAPRTGLIVKYDPPTGRWLDGTSRHDDWQQEIRFSLPDHDVFAIDAMANPPSELARFDGVGTVIFGLAVGQRPVSYPNPPAGLQRDQIFAANLESLNLTRFETALEGHIAENRVSVLGWRSIPTVSQFAWVPYVSPVALNAIDYTSPSADPVERDRTLAFPTQVLLDGDRLIVPALGSGAVGIFDANALAKGDISQRKIVRLGGGPSGVAVDDRGRIFVMDRFANEIAIVTFFGPQTRVSPARLVLHDPTPPEVRKGRRFLYEARDRSKHGDNACASCHVFGDLDGLAWDLGIPDGTTVENCNTVLRTGDPPLPPKQRIHPMKGPMTTQSLRGMAGSGPLHWRGDRSGCDGPGGEQDVRAAFKKFNGAFTSLLGAPAELGTAAGGELDQFTDFSLSIVYPPNPVRPLYGRSPLAERGRVVFETALTDPSGECTKCHAGLDRGTNGLSSEEGETQQFKIPHLRNLYQKVGMYGIHGRTLHTGEQVRGFGYLHSGGVDTLDNFLAAAMFPFPQPSDDKAVTQFMLEFDTGLDPNVGQQLSTPISLPPLPGPPGQFQIALNRPPFHGPARNGQCDLVARGFLKMERGGRERGFVYRPAPPTGEHMFVSDVGSEPPRSYFALRDLFLPAGWLTFTCVPPGEGVRLGIDRDCDGKRDGDDSDGLTPIPDKPLASDFCMEVPQ